MVFQGKTIELSYRIGYTVIDDGNAEKSLDEAEDALEAAAKNGLDICAYAGSWKKVTEAESAIADLMILSRNVSEKTIAVFYQPVVSLSSGKIAWNEALVRFRGRWRVLRGALPLHGPRIDHRLLGGHRGFHV